MPQMAPIMWLPLFILFMMFNYMIMSCLFFKPTILDQSKNSVNYMTPTAWKW